MPRNGTGGFALSQPPFVVNTTIDQAAVNADLSDIAAEITNSVAADGQTPMAGNLNMGSHAITAGGAASFTSGTFSTTLGVTGAATFMGAATFSSTVGVTGILTVASVARAANAAAATDLVNLGQFPSSLGASGYKKYADPNSPSGYFIEQWGNGSFLTGTVITFPIPFPTAVVSVLAGETIAGAWGPGTPSIHGANNITLTSFEHWGASWNGSTWLVGGVSLSSTWIAKGY